MNIVYDNIIFSLQKAGGISVYWNELIKRIKGKPRTIFFGKKNKNLILRETIVTLNESLLPISLVRYLPFLRKPYKNFLFHSSYYRFALRNDVVNIITVHDFTYEKFNKGIPKIIHFYQKSFAIYKANGIICVSDNTRNDLFNFYPKLKIPLVKVIYNGVGCNFFKILNPKAHLEADLKILNGKKYIVYIGDRSAYKNFNQVISIVKNRSDLCLVIIGGGKIKKKEKNLILPIRERILHFQGLNSEKINIIYNNAFCLFYPSSYEGFGIPILEAMKAGCPVVSTNFSSIPEVAGDAALLVDRIEADAFLEKLEMLEDPEFRSQLIEKGFKQAAKFSWDKCFEETYAFYEEVYQRKFG